MSSLGIKTAMARMLLICKDSAAIQQVAEGTQQFAIATEVCNEVSMALRLLNRQRFEAVVVDFGLDPAGEILEQVRLSPSNRTAVTFAIAGPTKSDSLQVQPNQVQPNFWIERPLSVSSVGRTFKAAFGLIVRERRRSFRCPVTFPAAILANGKERNCQVVNISESGMAIAGSGSLKPGGMLKVVFTLPGQVDPFTHLVGDVAEFCAESDSSQGFDAAIERLHGPGRGRDHAVNASRSLEEVGLEVSKGG